MQASSSTWLTWHPLREERRVLMESGRGVFFAKPLPATGGVVLFFWFTVNWSAHLTACEQFARCALGMTSLKGPRTPIGTIFHSCLETLRSPWPSLRPSGADGVVFGNTLPCVQRARCLCGLKRCLSRPFEWRERSAMPARCKTIRADRCIVESGLAKCAERRRGPRWNQKRTGSGKARQSCR
jgi:hypothetical protein